MTPDKTETLAERIVRHTTPGPGGCWIWTATTCGRGRWRYGQVKYHGTRRLAHRASYEASVGPIPEGYTVDHLCRTTLCVRPDHLEAVTQRENLARSTHPGAAAMRGTCRNGHPQTPENTYRCRGGSRCRPCTLATNAAWKRRQAV